MLTVQYYLVVQYYQKTTDGEHAKNCAEAKEITLIILRKIHVNTEKYIIQKYATKE